MTKETTYQLLKRFHSLEREAANIARRGIYVEYDPYDEIALIHEEQEEIAEELKSRGLSIPGVTEPDEDDGWSSDDAWESRFDSLYD